MVVTFIHHSCFLIETEQSYLLFDYTEGVLPLLKKEKPLFVLASHRHGDHFSNVIFDLYGSSSEVRYLLSYDIKKSQVPESVLPFTDFLHPSQVLTVGQAGGAGPEIRVETLKSTDEGVAFLVTLEGTSVYHAGDLNNWTWKGEPDSWNKNMQVNYRREIEKLAGRKIDLAFLPVDPRLGEAFYLGVDDFMSRVGAECVFPMHLWGGFDAVDRLKALPDVQGYADRIVNIHRDGEVFELQDTTPKEK